MKKRKDDIGIVICHLVFIALIVWFVLEVAL